jgi:hypothetical protein
MPWIVEKLYGNATDEFISFPCIRGKKYGPAAAQKTN